MSAVLTKEKRDSLVSNAYNQLFTSEGIKGLNYLKNRGITIRTIKEWKLGYCPEYVQNYLFNDRIIVPYFDQHEDLVAVSARKIVEEKPVWWNEKFEKKNYLFGLHKAKKHIFLSNLAIIFEGQFDTITFHQGGLKNAVSVCGSSLDDKQIALLLRYCNRFVIAFDTDENNAGQEASLKVFNNLKNKNIYIYRWFLPKGIDPDKYILKYGKDKCIEEIRKIVNNFSFKEKKGLHRKYYFGE